MFRNKYVKIVLFFLFPILIAFLSFIYNYAGVLFSAGPVTKGHSSFRDSCFKCHAVFSSMSNACLECHKQVQKTIDDGTGFHGNISKESQKKCILCHGDHKGEKFFIIHDQRSLNDLNQTISVIWSKNHIKNPPSIKDSYLKILTEESRKIFSWEAGKKEIQAGFEHSLTGYPLLGSHLKVNCEKCHKSTENFQESDKTGLYPSFFLKELSRQTMCYSCHKNDDEGKKGHQGKYGKDCAVCHLVTRPEMGWKALTPSIRDFHKDSRHLLKEKHGQTPCLKCHQTAPFKKNETESTCFFCHEKDDNERGHKGKYAEKCGDCHLEGGGPLKWKDIYPEVVKYHEDPLHKLKGKHEKLPCIKCHENVPFEKKDEEKSCYFCHKAKDRKTHKESLGKKCGNCHNEGTFEKSSFNHQKTKFALKESHLKIACTKCHNHWIPGKGKLKVYDKIETSNCVDCHARDDIHHGSFKNDCSKCHKETFWGDVINY